MKSTIGPNQQASQPPTSQQEQESDPNEPDELKVRGWAVVEGLYIYIHAYDIIELYIYT